MFITDSLVLLGCMIRVDWNVLTGWILLLLHILKAIIIELDVEFPVGVLFIDFFNDLVADFFVSLDHNESIAESVESSSSIALDDSG